MLNYGPSVTASAVLTHPSNNQGCHAGPRLWRTAPFFEGHFQPSHNRPHHAGLSGRDESAPRSAVSSLRSTLGWRSSQSNWNGGGQAKAGSKMLHPCVSASVALERKPSGLGSPGGSLHSRELGQNGGAPSSGSPAAPPAAAAAAAVVFVAVVGNGVGSGCPDVGHQHHHCRNHLHPLQHSSHSPLKAASLEALHSPRDWPCLGTAAVVDYRHLDSLAQEHPGYTP